MVAPTLHVYLKQFVSAANERTQEAVRRATPSTVNSPVLLIDLDSPTPVQDSDLQRWNDDGGHGQRPGAEVLDAVRAMMDADDTAFRRWMGARDVGGHDRG